MTVATLPTIITSHVPFSDIKELQVQNSMGKKELMLHFGWSEEYYQSYSLWHLANNYGVISS